MPYTPIYISFLLPDTIFNAGNVTRYSWVCVDTSENFAKTIHRSFPRLCIGFRWIKESNEPSATFWRLNKSKARNEMGAECKNDFQHILKFISLSLDIQVSSHIRGLLKNPFLNFRIENVSNSIPLYSNLL